MFPSPATRHLSTNAPLFGLPGQPPHSDRKVDLSDVHILIVDDTGLNRDLVSRMLIRLGFDPACLLVAHNGIEAVEWVRRHPCDLIFMDYHMPFMDGAEATRKIRAWERQNNRRPVPIIAFTSDASPSVRFQALGSGMDDFLLKPCRLEGVRSIINLWLYVRD
ncbi:MAG: response regulator [Magnetococcales bacterium]|nr:response regulator [Magnetococcales bacterium]